MRKGLEQIEHRHQPAATVKSWRVDRLFPLFLFGGAYLIAWALGSI